MINHIVVNWYLSKIYSPKTILKIFIVKPAVCTTSSSKTVNIIIVIIKLCVNIIISSKSEEDNDHFSEESISSFIIFI